MATSEKMTETIALSNWVRSFAEHTGFLRPNPPLEQIRTAIATCIPRAQLLLSERLVNTDAQKLLEDVLRITAIVQIGSEKISWSAARSSTEAEILQLIYSGSEYCQARHFLGIDVHWLLLVNPELLKVYTRGDLYEAHMAAYDSEDRPGCIIVAL